MRGLLLIVAVALTAGACSGDGSDESSTTAGSSTTGGSVTSLAATGSTVTSTTVPSSTAVTSTTTSAPDPEFPDYTVVSRQEGDAGDTVVVLLDPASYETLTDIDLVNVLADVVDRFPPILTAYVIDNPAVAEAVLSPTPTPDEQELLGRHYLVRLEQGFRMVFAGPFESTPTAILGS